MSEPLSSVEIEDVLTSIRRLVSEDLRPASRVAAPDPAAARPALILTPALRVVSDAVAVPIAVPEAVFGAVAENPVDAVAEVVLAPMPVVAPEVIPVQRVLAAVAAAATAQPQDWEPETGDSFDASGPGQSIDLPEAGNNTAMPRPGNATAMPGSGSNPRVLGSGNSTDLPEPGSFIDLPDAGWAEVGWDDSSAQPHADAPGWAQDTADDGGAGARQVDAGAAVAAGLAAPDRPAADAEWVEQAEAEVIAGLEQGRADAPFEFTHAEPEPEMTFDEEVLRDLVRDLIREELQGHLGERITRNIRKLVRAELARAMTAAELD